MKEETPVAVKWFASICALALYAALTMLLWNITIPSIFESAPLINFWQGLGLVLLFRVAK